jgi:hypothetical protein
MSRRPPGSCAISSRSSAEHCACLQGARARCEFDFMDRCLSVLAIFFVRAAAGQYRYDLKESPLTWSGCC